MDSEDEFDAMVKKPSPVKKAKSDDDDSDFGPPKKDGNGFKGSDSDSDFIKDSPPPKPPKKAAAPKPKAPPKAKAPAKKAKKASVFSDMSDGGSDSDDFGFGSSPKKAKGGAKKGKKPAGSDSDEASFDLSNIEPARDRPGRQRKTVNYQNFDDDSDEDY